MKVCSVHKKKKVKVKFCQVDKIISETSFGRYLMNIYRHYASLSHPLIPWPLITCWCPPELSPQLLPAQPRHYPDTPQIADLRPERRNLEFY